MSERDELVRRLRAVENDWATTACYNGTRIEAASLLERDAARAEAEALRKEAARADYVRKAFLLDDNDAIFEFCLAESVAEFNDAIDAVLATRVPDAAIAKEQKP